MMRDEILNKKLRAKTFGQFLRIIARFSSKADGLFEFKMLTDFNIGGGFQFPDDFQSKPFLPNVEKCSLNVSVTFSALFHSSL